MATDLKMRKLSTGDAFKLSKIFRQMELKEQVKLFIKGVDVKDKKPEEIEAIQKELGTDLFATIFEKLCEAETEVVDFLGGLVNMSGPDFLALPIEECIEVLMQFKDQKGLRSFFQLAAR